MAGKRKRDFREQQIEAMRYRLGRVRSLRWPLLLGGLVVLAASVFLGLSAFGILAFITAAMCLGRGIGYTLEVRRLRVSIAAAEERLESLAAGNPAAD